jgi:hypothetical protein
MTVSFPLIAVSSFYGTTASTLTKQHAGCTQLHPDYTHGVVTFIFFLNYTAYMTDNPVLQVPFDLPVSYRIQVQGKVAPSWSDRLQGMAISQSTSNTGLVVSTLMGELPDQSALAGVLITLHELHLSVLSVECLKVI